MRGGSDVASVPTAPSRSPSVAADVCRARARQARAREPHTHTPQAACGLTENCALFKKCLLLKH